MTGKSGISTARKTIFPFSKCSEKMVFPKKCTGIGCFLYYQEISYLLFAKIWSYSLDGNERWSFLKIYMEIWYFLYIQQRWYLFFLQVWYYTFFRKAKMIFSRKISGIIEKYDIHPRKCGISSDRKIKDDKKVYLVKYA